eukprot:SAG31_NODE_37833_length_301_cov_0.757426_1_plen_30_part_01
MSALNRHDAGKPRKDGAHHTAPTPEKPRAR